MAVKKNEADTEEKTTETTNTADETVKVENAANTDAEKDKKTVMYIGPQLPSGLLKTNTIIKGTDKEITEGLKEVFEKFPLVKRMLVPIEDVATKKIEVATKGKVLNKYYMDIQSQIAANGMKEG